MGAVNPKSFEVINLSMGRPVPANAHAPRGQKFSLSLQSSRRPASRSSYKDIILWEDSLFCRQTQDHEQMYQFKPAQHMLREDVAAKLVVPFVGVYNQEQSSSRSL